jgi:hypothetical protein
MPAIFAGYPLRQRSSFEECVERLQPGSIGNNDRAFSTIFRRNSPRLQLLGLIYHNTADLPEQKQELPPNDSTSPRNDPSLFSNVYVKLLQNNKPQEWLNDPSPVSYFEETILFIQGPEDFVKAFHHPLPSPISCVPAEHLHTLRYRSQARERSHFPILAHAGCQG